MHIHGLLVRLRAKGLIGADKKLFDRAFEEEMDDELSADSDADSERPPDFAQRSESADSSKKPSGPPAKRIRKKTISPPTDDAPADWHLVQTHIMRGLGDRYCHHPSRGLETLDHHHPGRTPLQGDHDCNHPDPGSDDLYPWIPKRPLRSILIQSGGRRVKVPTYLGDKLSDLVVRINCNPADCKFSLPHRGLDAGVSVSTLLTDILYVDPRGRGGGRSQTNEPLEDDQLPDADEAEAFESLVLPILVQDISGKEHDPAHFLLTHWSDTCQQELENQVSPSQRLLLDRLQKCFDFRSRRPNSVWSEFCILYDSFERLTVDPQPLMEFLAPKFGSVLIYDWRIDPSSIIAGSNPSPFVIKDRNCTLARAVYSGGYRKGISDQDLEAEIRHAFAILDIDWDLFWEDQQRLLFPRTHMN